MRLENLRIKLRLEWGELATRLGLSRSMLDMVRKGQRNLSFKALDRLEHAEREAGISPPKHVITSGGNSPESNDVKSIQFQEMGNEKGIDREELRRTIDEMKRLLGDLERIYKRK